MRFHYRGFEEAGHQLHELVDDESGFRLVVDSLGAEMVSAAQRQADGSWKGYLYRDGVVTPPASGWKNHATVMGYFIHRLKNEQTSYEGDVIRGGTHSFLRHKTFTVSEAGIGERGTLSFQLSANEIKPDEYPRKVDFRIDYTLADNEVEVVFGFHNKEADRPAHVSFGLHPGFAVSSVDQARIILPRGSYRRHLAPGNFLSGEVVEFKSDGRHLPIKPFELPDTFLIEPLEVDEPVVRLRDLVTGREVEVDVSDAPYFALWSDLNPFVCVEPCWGLPDHQQQEPFEKKLGLQVIPAGGTLARRCAFRFHG
jgi:galactose mutarotase-like enzyme